MRWTDLLEYWDEHSMYIREFYLGQDGGSVQDDSLKDMMHMKLKLIQKDLLANFSFYPTAIHSCQGSVINLPVEEHLSYAEDKIGCRLAGKTDLLILDAELYDYDFAISDLGSAGFDMVLTSGEDKVSLHMNDPEVIHINVGEVTRIRIGTTLHKATDEILRAFWPQERDCYLEKEFEQSLMAEISKKTENNCHYDRLLSQVLDKCHCIPKFADFQVTKTSYNNCHGEGMSCALSTIHNFTAGGYRDSDCLPMCQKTSYSAVDVRRQGFPAKEFFLKSQFYCPLTSKLTGICNDNASWPQLEAFETEYPSLCSLMRIANTTGQICSDSIVIQRLLDQSALADFHHELYRYASKNLALVTLERSGTATEKIRTEDMSVAYLFLRLSLIVCVILGTSLLGIFELFIHCMTGVCCVCSRKSDISA